MKGSYWYDIEVFHKKLSFSTIQNIKLSLVNNFDKVNMLEITWLADAGQSRTSNLFLLTKNTMGMYYLGIPGGAVCKPIYIYTPTEVYT